jgi:hypothetical protein
MRPLGVLTALALSGMTLSCAERMVSPAAIPEPSLPKAEPKPRPKNVETRRQVEKATEDTRTQASRARQAIPRASVKSEQRHHQAPLPQVSQQPQEPPIQRDPPVGVVLPPRPEPAEPTFPAAALIPPPPEPAEPTFPSPPPAIERPLSPEPTVPTRPEAPQEATMPPPPEPAVPGFPVATLPPPPEPAEPSLPTQEEVTAESLISIPFPDLPSNLSLSPRFDWVDTVGAIEVPRGPLPEAFEDSPERQIPSLIRTPWPLPSDP